MVDPATTDVFPECITSLPTASPPPPLAASPGHCSMDALRGAIRDASRAVQAGRALLGTVNEAVRALQAA
eukprot:14391015-Alexandrium_andersonii.AAC.1